jgi:hypothetical protein
MRFGLADPAVAEAGFHADVGAPLEVSTRESIGLLLLPAVPAKTVLAVVVALPVAGYTAPSHILYSGAWLNAVENVILKTFRAVELLPYPVLLFGIAITILP